MRINIGTIIILLAIALPILAQEPSATKDFDIENSGFGAMIAPLGTTINNRICIFYDHYTTGGELNLKSRVIGAAGSIEPMNLIAKNIEWSGKYHFDVVWHPKAKRYMIVFRKNDAIYVCAINRNGVPMSAPKKVADYDEDPLHITWTTKRMFVIFIARNGQLKAFVRRKNGASFRNERKMTNVSSGEVFPFDAATEEDGTAVAYYAHYKPTPKELSPGLFKTNNKLKKLDDFTVGSALTITYDYWLKTIYGAYDPVSGTHTMAWRFHPDPSQYCTFDKNGSMIQAPTNTPELITPRGIIYNTSTGRFAIFYYKLTWDGSTDHSEFYLMHYNPNGNIVQFDDLLKKTNAENDAHGCGYGKNGNILLGWVDDPGPGVNGRLIY